MRPNRLKEIFAGGGTAVNAWLSANSPYQAEALSHVGYDAVTVDLQHGMFGFDGAISLLQAVSAGPSMPMARTSSLDFAVIGKLLDAGAYGLICPSIDTAEQAARLVSYCRYPPTGSRSFGPSRGLLYGGTDYVERADDEILVWAMVESASALAAVEQIVATPGLDGIYVGPSDRARSFGPT
jgi:4-hydroxy-2-oxoheptanedioate aldolase